MCWCNRTIGCGNRCLKCCRYWAWLPFILMLSALVIYSVLGACKVYVLDRTVVAVMFGALCQATILLLMLLLIQHRRKIPPLCCGRRRCCFKKQKQKSLTEMLLEIDKNVPNAATLRAIEERAKHYLKDFSIALKAEFRGEEFHMTFTGSGAERFGLPLSAEWVSTRADIEGEHALLTDFDFMINLDNVTASFEEDALLQIVSDPTVAPGFTKLLVRDDAPCLKYPRGAHLNAKMMKERVYKSITGTRLDVFPATTQGLGNPLGCKRLNTSVEVKNQGPAIKVIIGTVNIPNWCLLENNIFLADLTFSIKCGWLTVSDWPYRQNRFWPSEEDVQRIVSYGCHLVAKSQEGDTQGDTWRFSFSKPEVELSKLVCSTARKCFLALKTISKDHLQPSAKWLASYHLKTIFFNMLEVTPVNFWTDTNIEQCFQLLLDKLSEALESRYCKHFWIPGINLFDTENISASKFVRLSAKLNHIRENPSWYIENWNPILLEMPQPIFEEHIVIGDAENV